MWKNLNKPRGGFWKYADQRFREALKGLENKEDDERELVRVDLERIKPFVSMDTLRSTDLQIYLNGSKRCGSVDSWNKEVSEFASNLTDNERDKMSCRPGLDGIVDLEIVS